MLIEALEEIESLEETAFISYEVADKNWARWAEMGRKKMGIIQGLDEWLNSDNKGKRKTITFDNTTLYLYRYLVSEAIKIAVIKYGEQMLIADFHFKESELSANNLLRFIVGRIYDNSKYLEASADEIQEIWSRERK